jgi:predicted ABC-type transport system involved in lysophospholipase L1 biosynthesis ATPase subunit
MLSFHFQPILKLTKSRVEEISMFHDTIIQAENIHRNLPQGGCELHILNGISFSVDAGSWVAFTGPSGPGKSTLVAILAGIDRPTSGKVVLEGMEISALPEGQLARICN